MPIAKAQVHVLANQRAFSNLCRMQDKQEWHLGMVCSLFSEIWASWAGPAFQGQVSEKEKGKKTSQVSI